MQLGNSWWGDPASDKQRDAAYREKYRTTVDPAWRLPEGKAPICWFTGTNDSFYWMPALMESYTRAGKHAALALYPNWNHGLPPNGDEQVFTWLDIHLQGKPQFIGVSPLTVEAKGGKLLASWTITPVTERPLKSAELIISYGEAGSWAARAWTVLPATLKNNAAIVELPNTAVPYFISGTAVDDKGFRSSTPLVFVKPADYKLTSKQVAPAYNGADWGNLEDDAIDMHRRMGEPLPQIVADARDGKQAAKLKVGKDTLLPILISPGVPGTLTCWLKAAAPVDATITLAVAGQAAAKTVTVGTTWTKATLEITPPAGAGLLKMEVATPAGSEVLIDSVSFGSPH